GHLKTIAKAEDITISDDALAIIAAHGEGSFRDSISLLDQVRSTSDKVEAKDVEALLGIAPEELVRQIVQAVSAHDVVATANSLQQIHENGYEPAQIARQIGAELRTELLAGKSVLDKTVIMQLLTQLLSVPSSPDPKSYLEIALLDAALTNAGVAKPAAAKVMPEAVQKAPVVTEQHPSSFQRSMPKPPVYKPEPSVAAAPTPATPKAPPAATETEDAEQSVTDATALLDNDAWAKVLAAVKAKHNTLFTIVRSATPHFEPGIVTLECGFAFHQKRLSETRNKTMLMDLITEATGQTVRLQCILGTAASPNDLPPIPAVLPPADEQVHTVAAVPKPAQPQNEDVAAISNIFGSAELLQS
ncbi:MAG TPA: hypothetical protein VLF43_03475, partial [Candidatus Saccharimonadales bacterium]|nr:hypothetical protein [Candidatus Saccharimonadales bacterium]